MRKSKTARRGGFKGSSRKQKRKTKKYNSYRVARGGIRL